MGSLMDGTLRGTAHTCDREAAPVSMLDPVPAGLPPISIYQVTQTEFYAGATGNSCREKFLADVAVNRSGVPASAAQSELTEFGGVDRLSDDELERMRFRDTETGATHSYRFELDKMIESGASFPIFFATSEY